MMPSNVDVVYVRLQPTWQMPALSFCVPSACLTILVSVQLRCTIKTLLVLPPKLSWRLPTQFCLSLRQTLFRWISSTYYHWCITRCNCHVRLRTSFLPCGHCAWFCQLAWFDWVNLKTIFRLMSKLSVVPQTRPWALAAWGLMLMIFVDCLAWSHTQILPNLKVLGATSSGNQIAHCATSRWVTCWLVQQPNLAAIRHLCIVLKCFVHPLGAPGHSVV